MDPLSSTRSRKTQAEADDADLRCPCYCEENVWRLLERRLRQQQQPPPPPPQQDDEYYVVFISNDHHAVAMLHQKAAMADRSGNKNKYGRVVWDYHVILLSYRYHHHHHPAAGADHRHDANHSTRPSNTNHGGNAVGAAAVGVGGTSIVGTMLVYDMDTTLRPYPLPLTDYLRQSFPSATTVRSSSRSTSSTPLHNDNDYYRPQFRIVRADWFRRYFASDRSHMWNATTRQYQAPPPPYECIVASGAAVAPSSSNSNPNHDDDKPVLLRNTLPYYLHFSNPKGGRTMGDVDHLPMWSCPLPREALGMIVSLEEFRQVEQWRSQYLAPATPS